MVAASFEESDGYLGRPESMSDTECLPLAVCRSTLNGFPVVISCWKLTEEELAEINRTGRVWLTVVGVSMPPVKLDGVKPI